MPIPFHLAFPVNDLETTHRFFTDLLGCTTGRTSDRWIDFNFWGHQITAHLVENAITGEPTNTVDGKQVPVKHFGAVLPWDEWHTLADRLKQSNIEFVIEPYLRFEGEVGEQATMFLYDPSGNALEFKSFKNPDQLFAH